jgi:DNA-binding NarL/FixJ family response regulator
MISIGVVDQHSFTRGCITRSLKDFDDSLEVISFTTSEDCLQSTKALDLILYHEHENVQQNNGTRLAPIRNLLEIAPVIVLSAADNLESVTQDHEEPAVYSASDCGSWSSDARES